MSHVLSLQVAEDVGQAGLSSAPWVFHLALGGQDRAQQKATRCQDAQLTTEATKTYRQDILPLHCTINDVIKGCVGKGAVDYVLRWTSIFSN